MVSDLIDYRLIITGVFVSFAFIEFLNGCLLYTKETKAKDIIIELVALCMIPVVIVPFSLYVAPILVELIAPGNVNVLSEWSWWKMVLVLLLFDDFTQYWWHRLAHSSPLLYHFHRAHHSARYMSVRVVYRNSLLYYFLMPGIWLSSALVYVGFGPVYVWYSIAKLTIIIGAHSSVAWDVPFYNYRITRPVIWLLSRIISTPMTHSAHHGRYLSDPATHYKGNYGNFLFFWDILFGTAKISEHRPKQYGVENLSPATWFQELIWPVRHRD